MATLTVFAMTKKGHAVVTAIHSRHPEMITAVIASRDSSMAEDYYDSIKQFCRSNGIEFFDRQDTYSITTEYSLAISWRWLVNTDASRLIVFHDSLLPRYRGFNPLVTALINGDRKIGVTALFATEDYDKGDVIAQSETVIDYPMTIAEAIDAIQANYVSLALEITDLVKSEANINATPQVEALASYSLWRDEEDYFIDWTADATTIRRIVDALGYPYKGAASILTGNVVRLLKVNALDDVKIENRIPGKVIFVQDFKPVIVCGHGLLRIDELVDASGSSVLPLPGFRMRFKGLAEQGLPVDVEKPRR